MDTIAHHTFYLAKDLYNQLNELQHPNGEKAVVLYMDTDFSDLETQGGIVTFNLLREDGSYVGYVEFQNMADLFNINVRTGCFCNSGSCQRHLTVSNKEMKEMYKAGHKCGDEIDLINGHPTGAIRMCMIKPEIDLKHKLLTLHFKGKTPITIPLDPNIENKSKSATPCTSKVCMDMVKGGNLIIDTTDELVEREWQKLTIGKHEFKVEGPCQRCHMICIDQETGEKTAEPLRTISEQFAVI
ncbi:unnamed protein product, partial [Iphiclides podalirius]